MLYLCDKFAIFLYEGCYNMSLSLPKYGSKITLNISSGNLRCCMGLKTHDFSVFRVTGRVIYFRKLYVNLRP